MFFGNTVTRCPDVPDMILVYSCYRNTRYQAHLRFPFKKGLAGPLRRAVIWQSRVVTAFKTTSASERKALWPMTECGGGTRAHLNTGLFQWSVFSPELPTRMTETWTVLHYNFTAPSSNPTSSSSSFHRSYSYETSVLLTPSQSLLPGGPSWYKSPLPLKSEPI